MGYRSNCLDLFVSNITSWFSARMRRSSYFQNIIWRGIGNVASSSGRRMMWMCGAIKNKKMVALFLVLEMLTMFNLQIFVGVSLICASN